MSRLVSIIIVNWNGKHHLEKCIPSLYKQAYKNFEIIVVDNASIDGSVEYLKKEFPKIKIVRNDKNLGYAEANNIGYKSAKGEYILFLNNDTKVRKNFLTNLATALEKSDEIGGVQSKILLMDHPSRLDSIGSYMTNTGFLFHFGIYAKNYKKYSIRTEIFSAKGACMMFKKAVLSKIEVDGEIFDSSFFAYFEETDMCHRVWLSGYKIVYIPSSVILHKFGATSKKLAKPFVEYHSYKNRLNSYMKNLGVMEALRIIPVHLVLCEGLSLVFIFRLRFDMFMAIQRALFWNAINLRRTLKKRDYIQNNIRKVPDSYFLKRLERNQGINYYLKMLSGWNVNRTNEKSF